MFVYREDDPAGCYLIPQASHAWIAWQVAEHWGNRRFARPAPRAEALAAILLHDGGWTESDDAPLLDGDGRPRTFDRMPADEHLSIWRRSVARASQYSRYSGLLVAAHFRAMAERKLAALLEQDDTPGARLAQSFSAEMERLEASWREDLATDARYQPFLEGPGREVNARLLDACDRISVYFCASLPSPFEVRVQNADGDTESITLNTVDATTWRVHPWPLQGERLVLHCEGRRLATFSFSSESEFQSAVKHARAVRLSFTLLRSSAIG
jgi:hypothetical protein